MRAIDLLKKLASLAALGLLIPACSAGGPEPGNTTQPVGEGAAAEADDDADELDDEECINGLDEDGEPCDDDLDDDEGDDDEGDDDEDDDDEDDDDEDDDDEDDDDEDDDDEDDGDEDDGDLDDEDDDEDDDDDLDGGL